MAGAITEQVAKLGAAFTGKAAKEANWLNTHALPGLLGNKGFFGRVGGLVGDVLFAPFKVASWLVGGTVKVGTDLSLRTVVGVSKATGAGAVHVAKQPVVGGLKILTAGAEFIRNNWVFTGIAALGAALVGLANGSRHKAAVDTQSQLMAQATGGQSYMNSVSPQEAAAMNARLQQGSGSFADAAAQRDGQAPAVPAV